VLEQMPIRQADFARAMGISTVRLNQILNGRAPITPEMALRLARVTGSSPEYWLALQNDWSLHKTRARLRTELDKLPVLVQLKW